MKQTQPLISIVVPFYNEEDNVVKLHQQLANVLDSLSVEYELIFVDDGSTDQTLQKMLALKDPDSRVRIIKLWSNSGQTAGLAAGFDRCRGSIIISMDGDLQHDPSEIPEFLKWIDAGYDVVSGWRKYRVDPFISRKLPSQIANWIMARLSGLKIHDFGTTFKAYRSEIIHSVTLYGQYHRFIPVLVEGIKPRIKEIPIRSIPRGSGTSKYNIGRTFTVFFDLIRIHFLTKYLTRPLHVFGTFGVALGSSGFGIAVYLSALKFLKGMSIMEQRAPLFLLSILLMLVGTQFLTMGLLGEILVKMYHKLPNTRVYSVEAELTPGATYSKTKWILKSGKCVSDE
ncbi:glycosyltransferase family 2 protein [bacterium]|nr:glycosyltransferase family 2 protein [candidate division CSSED10-310 bacterium]